MVLWADPASRPRQVENEGLCLEQKSLCPHSVSHKSDTPRTANNHQHLSPHPQGEFAPPLPRKGNHSPERWTLHLGEEQISIELISL